MQREWRLRGEFSDELLSDLRSKTQFSELTLRVCLGRGLESPEAIEEFLNPKLEKLTHFSKIRDMDRAMSRMVTARAGSELVRVFGDYDVDGTTGAALLSWVLSDFGFRFDARQPDRFKDGYGLNPGAVEEASRDGVKVLVTVDCGITSFDAAKKAKELGIDLIIIDHHQIDPRGLPEACAILNPQRADCESGLRQLCGCGVAFYFSLALRSAGRDFKWFEGGREPNLKQHLDLVVMATAADMVPLTGDNHILVRHGMDVLKSSSKPGVQALLQTAGILEREISPSHLGFVIGPRINASGRMQHANIALEMLTSRDASRAIALAQTLERLNDERAVIQNQIWDEVRARVSADIELGKFKNGIVVADSGWHEGVVGIVASRVTETFKRPAVVLALREDHGKGSARTWAGKDVLAALRGCAHELMAFGGHKHAAGVSVALDRVDAFAAAFDLALGSIEEDAGAKPLYIEGKASIEDFDIHTILELERLGPFGPGNPEPVFSIRASISDHRILKERHLKLNLSPVGSKKFMEAIWFGGAEQKDLLEDILRSEADWAGVPELNRFRGNVTPTLRVRDWHRLS